MMVHPTATASDPKASGTSPAASGPQKNSNNLFKATSFHIDEFPEDMRSLLEELDLDGSGSINKSEFVAAVKALKVRPAPATYGAYI